MRVVVLLAEALRLAAGVEAVTAETAVAVLLLNSIDSASALPSAAC